MFWKLAGPGLVVAATGIGSGDVVSATVGGARYGVVLLWAIAAGAFFKFVLSEGIARWQLATGKTALEGWAEHLPAVGQVVLRRLPGDLDRRGERLADQRDRPRHRQPHRRRHPAIVGRGRAQPDRRSLFVLLGGYGNFEKLMKLLVGVMGFSILVCAGFTLHNPLTAVAGPACSRPFPLGSGTYVLSLIGGVGGSITMLSYNYWMREEKMRGAGFLSYVRGDIAIAYIFTALFGISIMLIANDAFFMHGVPLRDAEAVPKMAAALGTLLGAVRPHRVLGRASGRRCSRRCSACGRACRISMPTSTAS